MGTYSKIQWTDVTWNPLRGCRRISPGCEHCYAERQAARPILSGPGKPYEGLVALSRKGPQWSGWTAGPDKLDEPVRWRKPRKVFVCSMSDLFFEAHSDEAIDRVWAVMLLATHHTFQVLTKRPERAAAYLSDPARYLNVLRAAETLRLRHPDLYQVGISDPSRRNPNVWIGTSVEDQQRADERIPHLLRIPAAVRFVSYEPAPAPVDFSPWLGRTKCPACGWTGNRLAASDWLCLDCEDAGRYPHQLVDPQPSIDWLIVGGESGAGARPFDLAWARAVVAQARAAGVPVFVKQMGSEWARRRACAPLATNRGGGAGADPAEWPADLRVREWPEVRR